MADTGCDKCTIIGSPNLCLEHEIEYWDDQAEKAMAMVERLKKKKENEPISGKMSQLREQT